ncbi:ABC transporter permease [Micromonospora carbonacea]|uniref:ABC transporter permease n=1 Tax=Micromonospora carbonacea TaxID=47853 RepID=A0A1C5ARH2_9ACTN|nr:ABC transporter permease [Micromonospora carbonacea]MBB5828529.1 putative ABC transport system permease protein [Micromonospora carbonacea]QLD23872.1 ABC transporter permease [Micromonospora carbonacea]SCF47818.1 putative ABC transport system permease protein [Micromonospora carbonacea]
MTVRLPPPARLSVPDLIGLATVGIRARPARTVLAALGITIGIAALIAVLGIPASNQAAVRAGLAALGPNLLTVTPGQNLVTGERAQLPAESVPMIQRIAPVQSASAIGYTSARVRRTNLVPEGETNGLAVAAARLDLPTVLRSTMRAGVFLDRVTEQYPAVVLGARASELLGIEPHPGEPAPPVWINDRWYVTVGVLDRLPLAPEIDNSVLVGWPAAQRHLGFDGRPQAIFVRVDDEAVDDVRAVLGRTANPQRPEEVLVSRPSDALAAQRLVEQAYSSLFLGLGAVALLVGGIGVANTMIISVLERRREIGLRRALGASRGHVASQFLAESVLLTGIGGALGILLGAAVTAGYAVVERWPAVLPPTALLGGLAVAVGTGVLAGVYPAVRAARLAPTEALNTN